MKEDILGYAVDALSVEECVDSVFSSIEGHPSSAGQVAGVCRWLACWNPHSYAVALHDDAFRSALLHADWLIPDGAGVVLASRMMGGSIRARVTGSDVFEGLHRRMNEARGMSVFFLGTTEQTLATIRQRMARDYPGIRVAGACSPPFKPTYSAEELEVMIQAINEAAPDVLWVGMTAPKQEKWIFENQPRLAVKFAGAVGAVFDFYAGTVARSDPVFQRVGLEWLPRLLREPRRLWRRTFVSAPLFLWHVLKRRVCSEEKWR